MHPQSVRKGARYKLHQTCIIKRVHTGARYLNSTKNDRQKVLGTISTKLTSSKWYIKVLGTLTPTNFSKLTSVLERVHTGARYINSTKGDPQKVIGTLNPPQVHRQAPHKFRFRLYYGGEKRHKKDPLTCLFLCVVKKEKKEKKEDHFCHLCVP